MSFCMRPITAEAHCEDIFSQFSSNVNMSKSSEMDKRLYRMVKSKLFAIADGSAKTKTYMDDNKSVEYISTKIRLTDMDFKNIRIPKDKSLKSDEIQRKLKEKLVSIINIRMVLNRIYYDCPYAMYWNFNGYYTIDVNYKKDKKYYFLNSMDISFIVGKGYRAISREILFDNTMLDPTCMKTAARSINNAKKIVKKYAKKSDYAKLRAYFNEVKKLTRYDDYITNTYDHEYTYPWNYTSVLDGNMNTNSVCTGYSEAFKMLCDLSKFKSQKIKVYIMRGTLKLNDGSEILHEWNVITMPDGKNYVADLTNCDEGYLAAPDLMFPGKTGLSPISNDALKGPTYQINDQTTFEYEPEDLAIQLYGTGKNSILNISSLQYNY